MDTEHVVQKVLKNIFVELEASGRHVHVTKAQAQVLFGHPLTPKRPLSQPGQYLANERVTVIGPKGQFENVAVLGPERKEGQVEISLTDGRTLGLTPPVRLSGAVEDTPGATLAGTLGKVELKRGVIAAKRHIHMTPEDAARFGVTDKQVVRLQVFTDREAGRFNRFAAAEFQDQNYRVMLTRLMEPEHQQRLDIIAVLLELLNQLYRLYQQRGESEPAAESSPLFQVIRHINEHLSEPLSLDSLCEQFYLSKPQLCRSFKRTTGASVGEYITAKRLLQAQSMLRAGSPPTQVCTACGFNDYSAFYRAYVKHFGVSPRNTQQAGGTAQPGLRL